MSSIDEQLGQEIAHGGMRPAVRRGSIDCPGRGIAGLGIGKCVDRVAVGMQLPVDTQSGQFLGQGQRIAQGRGCAVVKAGPEGTAIGIIVAVQPKFVRILTEQSAITELANPILQ